MVGTWQRRFDPDLRVTFLSVGEGDAAVVRFPGSRVMLIDAGGGFRRSLDPGERIVAPYLWSRKIMRVDYLVLSHPDRDHFGGFDFIARNFHPAEFWSTGAGSPDVSYAGLIAALEAAGVRMRTIDGSAAPMRIGGVDVTCLGPPSGLPQKRNNTSMVLRFAFGPAVLLFTGDLEAKGEREVLSDEPGPELASTILKVPHHGSRTSSSEAFIEAVHPEAAVISLGYHNRFHFPAQSVLERYRAVGARVLRTDEVGAVSIDVSAHAVRMRSWRNGAIRLPARRERALRHAASDDGQRLGAAP
jgi:competence protein ComEC